MTLGQQIKHRRKCLGMTQEKLAAETGIKRQHLTRLENDITKNPSLNTLSKLSVALQCNLFNYLEVETFDTPEDFELARNKIIQNTHTPNEQVTLIYKATAEEQLLTHFKKLNKVGEIKAIEQVELLTRIPELKKQVPTE